MLLCEGALPWVTTAVCPPVAAPGCTAVRHFAVRTAARSRRGTQVQHNAMLAIVVGCEWHVKCALA